MIRKLVMALLCSIGVAQVYGQSVSGTVLNERSEGIPYVKITLKSNNKLLLSDGKGFFQIQVANLDSEVLVFSAMGYQKLELPVQGKTNLTAVLKELVQDTKDVVVVGYGTSKTKELTGATSKVKGEDIEKMNMTRMDQALQGQVSGVTVSSNSGSPGGSSNIRIRGLSTFGDNDPLILVDGVVYDSEGLNALNPSDIKSINVLKDATAGIYGVRAANGVIIVETKNGAINRKPSMEYNGYYGIQQTARKLDLLTAEEYAVIKNEAFAFGGQAMPFSNTNIGTGTNWQDSVFSSAPVQSHNLSLSGGTLNTRYSIGLGYFNQEGIVGADKANFGRYNARLNFSTDMSEKLKLNSVLLFSSDMRSTLPENGIGSVLYNTINAFPNDPVYSSPGTFSYMEEVSDIINPIAQMMNQYNWSTANKFVGKEEFIYEINENLSFTNRFNYNYANVDSKVFSPLVWYGEGKYANTAINADLESPEVEIADSIFITRGAAVYEERSTFLDLTYESFLNYEKTWNETHKVKGTLGASVFERKGQSLNGIAFGIPNNSLDYADISANTAQGGYLNNVNSWEFKERLLSAFMRAEYAYKEKYLISGILRRDGSSKFGPNSRWGIFPTISGGWLLSEEDFFKSKSIDYLKLRMSYGVSGNDQIPNFAYRALLNGEGVYVFDDLITQGAAIGRPANPDLKWETTRQFNVGVDLTWLKVLNFTTNYFIKNTNDLLFQPDVSALLGSYGPGGYPPIINAGDVSNKGWEFEVAYQSDRKNLLQTGLNFNFTTINNKVVSVPAGVQYIPGASFSVGGDVATRFQEGYEIGYFFGYQTAGVFQTQEEIDNAAVVQEGAQPGDLIFVDQNGDGKINFSDDSDKTNLGSAIPDFTMGFAFNFKLHGFDLSGNVYAALGQEIIRNYERQQPYANQLAYVIDRWTGPGSTNEHPRLTTGPTNNNLFSDYFVEDGSFVRLRNLQFGYTLPSTLLRKIHVESLRVYVAANNLITLTRYMGFDPDLSSSSVLSAGVDYGMYPQARSLMSGLQIKF
ncbi:MAG: TonB-dependent receptor [Crocinitomicaceae bacterium]|nr:TonB-dependent receptor [Crocinitomicaceae bacterium]